MDYQFKYKLDRIPEARTDGSGMVAHDIYALASSDGENWDDVPGRHKTICIPASELNAALAESGTPAIVAAYKDALAANLNTQPVAITGWTSVQLEALMDANDAAAAAASAADAFITETLGLSYPVTFSI